MTEHHQYHGTGSIYFLLELKRLHGCNIDHCMTFCTHTCLITRRYAVCGRHYYKYISIFSTIFLAFFK